MARFDGRLPTLMFYDGDVTHHRGPGALAPVPLPSRLVCAWLAGRVASTAVGRAVIRRVCSPLSGAVKMD